MSNKPSNIKTFSDIGKQAPTNTPFNFGTNNGSGTTKKNHEDQIRIMMQKMFSNEEYTKKPKEVEPEGNKLGGYNTKDVRKARLSYYDNLPKAEPTKDKQ